MVILQPSPELNHVSFLPILFIYYYIYHVHASASVLMVYFISYNDHINFGSFTLLYRLHILLVNLEDIEQS